MIPLHKPFIPSWDNLGPALKKVFESGQISQGAEVEEFERRFGDFVDNHNVLAVSSCTAALHLALMLADVREWDEVVSTPMTAEPTNLAIHHAGAHVRWADVDPLTGNVTKETLDAVITERTTAVMLVHYGGISVSRIIFRDYRGFVVEDCAHALGCPGIGWGDCQCYSFQAIKHLTTVEGGSLVLSHATEDWIRRARLLRWFGIDRSVARARIGIEEIGWKYNLTNVQAVLGLLSLGLLRDAQKRQAGNVGLYNDRLSSVLGLRHASAEGPLLFYTVLAEHRDDLARKLQERGVECGQVHRRNDEHFVFAYAKRPLPGLDEYWSKMLHIPCGWWVTPEDMQYIIDIIRSGW